MKIIYSSTYLHSADDIFPPSDSRLALNEYTFINIFNGLEHSYDFENYRAGHDLYQWQSTLNGYIAFVAKNKRIEVRESKPENIFLPINSKFENINFLGMNELNAISKIHSLGDRAVKAYPYGVDNAVHFELFDDLNKPPIAVIEKKYERYVPEYVYESGLITINDRNEGKVELDFFDHDFELEKHLKLKVHAGAQAYDYFVKDNRFYVSARPLSFFCISLENHEVLWELKLDWAYQVMMPFGIRPEQYGSKICIQARDEHRWALLDLDTGAVTQNVKIELSSGVLPITAHPFGMTNYKSFYCESFVFVQFSYHMLLVYDAETGKKLHEIACPNEFSFLTFVGFKSDCFYFYLRPSAGGTYVPYSGVLIIPREELLSSEPLKLELEEKGDIHHNIIPDGEYESYEVIASYDNMGDALRFIQIEVNTIVCLFSYTPYCKGTSLWKLYVNQKFNGKITVKIDRNKLKDRDDSKFDQMVSLLNEYYQEISFAPIGEKLKKPVHAQVQWEYF